MADSQIEWTDATWNPVAGCSIVTKGCTNCYAMQMARRLEAMGVEKYRGLTRKSGKRVIWNGLVREDRASLQIPHSWKKPKKIFVNSMSDLFHEGVGAIERLVFETFSSCAPFASPFSIQNPSGWRYWLIHFAKRARARQVYNDVLHANSSSQAHFGRPGLNMLSYNPREDGVLYLFDMNGRDQALKQLFDDIPRLLDQHGDTMNVGDFYEEVYNLTPAHSDDIHAAMINNPDLEVITPTGGARRSPGSITIADTLRLKIQRSFLPLFIDGKRRG